MNQTYELLKTDIVQFFTILKKELDNNDIAKQLYKGYRMFYSPLILNPTVLIIGINPGAGAPNIEYLDPEEKFEYLEYDYPLAKETKDVFKETGFAHLLENSTIKINYYYLITSMEKDLYKLIDLLKPNLRKQFYEKSGEWTKRMIELLNPKLIICEGKRAYDNVTQLFAGEWKETKLNNCWVSQCSENNIPILGYNRRFSYIMNKKEVTELLKPLLIDKSTNQSKDSIIMA